MEGRLSKVCLTAALAMVCLNSVWALAMAATDPSDGKGSLRNCVVILLQINESK